MYRKTARICGLAAASLMIGFMGTAAHAAAPSQEDAGTSLQERLPENFPIPAETVEVDQPDSTKVVCEVPGYSAEELIAFFRQKLPEKGHTVMAQNPPRVSTYRSPVTLVVRTEKGEMRGVQIHVEENGAVRFTVS